MMPGGMLYWKANMKR